MALFGTLPTLRAQAPQTPAFAAAFAYVEDLMRPDSPALQRLRAIGRGESKKIELAHGALAIEQVYETKARADGFFESHRKMIDLQVVVEGEELMEVVDLSRVAVRQAYDAEKDYALYADAADASQLKLTPGLAAIFFPPDVHMPTLRLRGVPVLVRKTVVKIPVA
ncbi:MAG: YhcH/YjgK/YiaL family protein [Opitutaceae bacterium]|nr:YhcH/YjgK/YiaL family protein [Opitutaceae bacterium]